MPRNARAGRCGSCHGTATRSCASAHSRSPRSRPSQIGRAPRPGMSSSPVRLRTIRAHPHQCSSLALVAACLTVTVAIHCHPRKSGSDRRELSPDPGRQILQGRRAQICDFVQEVTVETIACIEQCAFEEPQVEDHTSLWVGHPPHRNLGTIGVTVDSPTRLRLYSSLESMCGFETELLA